MRGWLALGLALVSQACVAVSFDCTKASGYVEQAICQDPILGRLDDALSQNFRGMLVSDVGVSPKVLRAEQGKWLKQRNQCATAGCIEAAYRARLDETCDYPVVSGVHALCTLGEDVR